MSRTIEKEVWEPISETADGQPVLSLTQPIPPNGFWKGQGNRHQRRKAYYLQIKELRRST